MNSVRKNPLRTCPKCGRRFLTRNLWHSCGRYRLADPFAGKPRVLRRTFNRFASLARACGPVDIYAQKTRIVIQAQVRFAGAVGRQDWLDAGVWLKRRACHPRLHRLESSVIWGMGCISCFKSRRRRRGHGATHPGGVLHRRAPSDSEVTEPGRLTPGPLVESGPRTPARTPAQLRAPAGS